MSKRGAGTGLEARTTVVDSGSLEFVVDYDQTKDFAGGHDWWTRFWIPDVKKIPRGVGISGYRSVTANPEHPREIVIPDKKSRIFF